MNKVYIASRFSLLIANFAGPPCICSTFTPVWRMQPKCHATHTHVSTSSTRPCTLQSSTPLPYILTPINALAVSPLTIWSGTVHFPRQIRWRKLHRRVVMTGPSPVTCPSVTRPPHGNTPNGTPLRAQRDATCSSERLASKEPIVNGHKFVKLAGEGGGGDHPEAVCAIVSPNKIPISH